MRSVKRIVDVILCGLALFLLMPVFLFIALWIKTDSPGPVFFRQKRVGIHKSYFDILKFRTMRTDTPQDTPTHLLKNPEQYITRSGAFLRKTSLDELPQLINILKGEMSIVGPRPALWNQYDLVAERDRYGANDVLPGLTGWAQINGRDTISIQEKAKLDGYYVEHQSLRMDMECMIRTVFSVLKHEGVQEGGPDAGVQKTGASEPMTGGKKDPEELSCPVSIVIATRRREKELERALASVAGQTYRELEVVLVDDNADTVWNEKVQRIVRKWREKTDIPLRYLQNAEKCGSAETRNRGIRAAGGTYITFLDDDDKYLKKKVENQVRHMVKENSDFSITDLALYREDGRLEEVRTRRYLNEINRADTHALLACHLRYHLTGTDTLMFKKSYLEKIGGFPPIDVGDEFYLMEEAILGGGRFSYLAACDVKAIVHTVTEGLSSREKKINGENALFERKKTYFGQLTAEEVRAIRMRHHLVLAYAYIRDGKKKEFLQEGLRAVCCAPLGCIKMVAAMPGLQNRVFHLKRKKQDSGTEKGQKEGISKIQTGRSDKSRKR